MTPDYCVSNNGLAQITNSGDHIITCCVVWTPIVLFVLPLLLQFNTCINVLHTIPHIIEHFRGVGAYTMHIFYLFLGFYHILKEFRQLHLDDENFQQIAVEQILKESSPPPDEFIKQVTEQLILASFPDKSHSLQET